MLNNDKMSESENCFYQLRHYPEIFRKICDYVNGKRHFCY